MIPPSPQVILAEKYSLIFLSSFGVHTLSNCTKIELGVIKTKLYTLVSTGLFLLKVLCNCQKISGNCVTNWWSSVFKNSNATA